MKKIFSFLASSVLMGTLFLILAASMGIATFVENDFGTNAAKALFYNAWWFELVFVLLGINMLLNMTKLQLWKIGKLPILFFHMSFLLIVVGAAFTRYIGYEGMMHIREGESSNKFLSLNTYIQGSIENNGEVKYFEKDVLLSERSKDYFKQKLSVGGEDFYLESVDYIQNSKFVAIEGEDGKPFLSLVVSGGRGRNNVDLFYGEKISIGGYEIGFGADTLVDFNITQKGEELFLQSKHEVAITDMGTQQKTPLDMSVPQPFYSRVLYGVDGFFIVQTNFMPSAVLKSVSAEKGEQGNFMESVTISVAKEDESKNLAIQGRKDMIGVEDSVLIGKAIVKVRYGAKELQTPFEIHLRDFQIERYPGSESPSSFASEITLKDTERGVTTDFRIFMNNILNYRGYRFYQSSYDTDERGSFLSVNNDLWGTIITYIGYFIMSVSMILSLITSKSRFRYLASQVYDLSKKRKTLLIFALLGISAFTSVKAQDIDHAVNVSKEQAGKFGALWVQDNGGRIKPMNSMTGEIMRKLVKHNTFKGYSSDQIVLSIVSNPEAWKNIPLITVKPGPIKDVVGNIGKKAAFSDFFGASSNYKLHELVESAYRTKPAYRTKEQNELIKIDEQVNVFYLTQSGKLFKMFPNPSDINSTWMLPGEYQIGMSQGDSMFVRNVFGVYLQALGEGKSDEAFTYIDAIEKYQNKFAEDILPSRSVKNMELFYNKSNIFLMMAPIVFGFGFLLLIIHFAFLFMPKKSPKGINLAGGVFITITFVAFTAALALRWYISGHAPWSNGYESMLYIGWAIVLAGLVLSKRSPIVVPIAALFSGIVLLVAHLSWMNPEITNLVPVLKSYWLTIHVAVIVASYGFLGLGAKIGFVNLILIGLQKDKNDLKIAHTVKELTAIMEMGLTIGLYLMTIGAFLGGVWANESWGRYWGWDPKETWSLVTIMIYAFVLHMRFIPALKNMLVLNIVSVFSFFSVIMTYFGVNYYLAGMHSYAKGDPVPVPDFVYYTVLIILVVSVYAAYNSNRLENK